LLYRPGGGLFVRLVDQITFRKPFSRGPLQRLLRPLRRWVRWSR